MENTDRRRSGLSGKRHAVADINGLPMRLALTNAKALDSCFVLLLLAGPEIGRDVACGSVDRGYDAEWTRAKPPTDTNPVSVDLNGARNPVEPLFNKIEQCRRFAVATSN